MGNARLTARPNPGLSDYSPLEPGIHKLASASQTQRGTGALLVPHNLSLPAPLMLMLHGAGGNSSGALSLVASQAQENGVMVLAPVSHSSSWDIISLGDFGPDVCHIDQVLSSVFERCPIDPERIAAAGFSDGGSYALSIGLHNPDLFRCILAFSPGFMRAPPSPLASTSQSPKIYVSHGKRDAVLHIDRCSRRIVQTLERQRYNVVYREFEDGHSVPSTVVEEGMDVLLEKSTH